VPPLARGANLPAIWPSGPCTPPGTLGQPASAPTGQLKPMSRPVTTNWDLSATATHGYYFSHRIPPTQCTAHAFQLRSSCTFVALQAYNLPSSMPHHHSSFSCNLSRRPKHLSFSETCGTRGAAGRSGWLPCVTLCHLQRGSRYLLLHAMLTAQAFSTTLQAAHRSPRQLTGTPPMPLLERGGSNVIPTTGHPHRRNFC
jgi:hypothetical protein